MNAAAALLAAFLLAPAGAQERSPQGVNFYSLEKELALGRQEAAVLRRELSTVREPRLEAYVARLASELAKHADPRFPYGFTLFDYQGGPASQRTMAMPFDAFQGPLAEPVALAGGPIFVPLGLLAEAPNEAVFAFQLAHAIAHVALRHATRMATRAEATRISGAPVNGNQQAAMRFGLLNLAREFELQADAAATGILAGAGYDPEAMARYLEAQPPAGNEGMSTMFSAHATAAERVEAIRAEIRRLPPREYAAASGEFEAMKALAASLAENGFHVSMMKP